MRDELECSRRGNETPDPADRRNQLRNGVLSRDLSHPRPVGHLVALVRAGATFKKGVLIENSNEVAA